MESSHPVQRGITLTYDDAVWDVDTSGPLRAAPLFVGGMTGGVVPAAGDDSLDADTQWLVSHLQAGGDVSAEPLPALAPRAGASARAIGPAPAPHVDVELGDDETAVLLVESEGVVAWQFGDEDEPSLAQPGVRATPVGTTRRVRFRVSPPDGAAAGDAQKRNVAVDWTLHRMRAVVLKFVARKTVQPIVRRLERDKRDGPVVISGSASPSEWTLSDDFAQVALPDRPARILLLVHGTFSSTVGGFGELCATAWGQAFLEEASTKYDAVLGYDHRTLSADPHDNAKGLYAALRTLKTATPPTVDIVCHSRGGLVVRSLIERVLPQAAWQPVVGRVVFVAATNAGTELARPENWKSLIDLTTNLVLAGRRALAILGAPHVAMVAGEIIDGIGDFVRYLVDAAVQERLVPGLAAMDPAGPFVLDINRVPPQDRDEQASLRSRYYAIESNFQARLLNPDQHEPKEFPRRLALMFANGFIDTLMKEAHNDLVVNTSSMTSIDGSPLDVKVVQDFGTNAVVYHTNYFIQPETVDALARWLGLASPGAVEAVEDALLDRQIVVVDATESVGLAMIAARKKKARYVVVRASTSQGAQALYGAPRMSELQDIMGRGKDLNRPVGDLLALSDDRRSLRMDFGDPALRSLATRGAPSPDPGLPAFTRRIVVVDGAEAMAVVPAPDEVSAIDLMAQASIPVLRTVREARGGVRGLTEEPSAEPEAPDFFGSVVYYRDRVTDTGGDEVMSGASASMGRAPPVAAASLDAFEPPMAAAPLGAPESLHAAVAPVVCNVLAEMPTQMKIGATATVTVTLSVDEILAHEGMANAGGQAEILPGPVTIEVRPRSGFELKSDSIGDSRVVIEGPPAAGKAFAMDVEIVATDVGTGKVSAIVRQGPVRRLELVLECKIVAVDAGTSRRTASWRSGSLAAVEDLPEVATLEIWQQRNNDETRFLFGVEIPGVAFNRFESKRITGDLATWVDTLYKGIEQAWLGSNANREIFHDNLKAKGGMLIAELVPLELRRLLWRLHQDHRLGSLLLRSDEPFVPWEIAYLDDPDQPGDDQGCFLGELGLCRWLYGSVPVTKIEMRAERLRYLVPHYPEPRYRLAAAEQVEEPMLVALGAQPIEPHYASTRDALKAGGFDLLHFAGHGGADSGKIGDSALLLEGVYLVTAGKRSYVTEPLSVNMVSTIARLRGVDGSRPLVILNACQAAKIGFSLTSIGGFAPAFLGAREGVGNAVGEAGAFVSSLWSVGDQTASTFAQTFYEAIKVPGGTTIGRAAIAARAAARQAGDATWLSYAVYAHPNCHVEFVP